LIHNLSNRSQQPFLTVNCGALAASVIESELFGHIKGAFTGADRDRVGKFAEVGRGTLLLDEIDALPLTLQPKLLRVVEERVFEPIGSNRSLPMPARLIVASNRALDQEVSAGRFRSDLYYRLHVVGFYLQPLRERREIIPALVQKFVHEYARTNGRPVRGITPEARRALAEHHWPGNIRELRNVIECAVALCPTEEIQLEDLPEALQGLVASPVSPSQTAAVLPGSTLDEVKQGAELTRILDALKKNNNNRLRAAADLGISRMTLYKKLHKYGLIAAHS
jgi:DNA-binding NtrC family response regulator